MDQSYSFKKIHEKNGITTYYTKPSKMYQYDDAEEALKEYNKIFNHLGNNKWSWIIDGDGFEFTYALEMKSGVGFAKLITGPHGNHLQEIKIINPTWAVRAIIKFMMPFLNDSTRKKVKLLSDRTYSILEFL